LKPTNIASYDTEPSVLIQRALGVDSKPDPVSVTTVSELTPSPEMPPNAVSGVTFVSVGGSSARMLNAHDNASVAASVFVTVIVYKPCTRVSSAGKIAVSDKPFGSTDTLSVRSYSVAGSSQFVRTTEAPGSRL